MTIVFIGGQLLPAWNLHAVPHSVREKFHFRLNSASYRSEFDQWRFMKDNTAKWQRLGEALAKHFSPDDSIVLGAIGRISYYSRLFVFDRFGLVTPEISATKSKTEKRSPGHDKIVSARYFLKYSPTIVSAFIVSPSDLAKKVAQHSKRWKLPPFYPKYAPQTFPLDPIGSTERVLLTLRLVQDTESADSLWRNIDAAPFDT